MTKLFPLVQDDDTKRVMFWCLGCDMAHPINVTGEPGPSWSFNGSFEKPTFQPSVLVRFDRWTPPVTTENHAKWRDEPWEQTKVEHVCHTFVTDGRIQYLGDCTHALAGQTIDLPCWDWDNVP